LGEDLLGAQFLLNGLTIQRNNYFCIINKILNMDLKDIQELIKFVAKSGATEVDLEIDNIKISIKSPAKKKRGGTDEDEITTIIPPQAPVQVMAAPIVSATPVATITANPPVPAADENSNYITIKASMIGTFYRSTSPESPPFVSVGDIIKEGDALCVIEAMKLFNEIESEISGKIVKVLVDDSTPIEFDQALFLVDPS
jgi:acetyl-CoA carboxylase biotin carboxyl carrier protein